ncbi:hypothetical protein SAMN02910340_01902 [Methanosarcina thermophila]|jgi:hypothetical protein|uniref:Uncharacterized protein n=3 Tax=Methanosarcina thermophila TaxID=2210 RepID=A0A1I7A6D6_METTE|nr:hypothetical protein [Methanosarcina thermophila]ALK05532.1 MAG: hypothetical protein AAY43_07210 [Methanosarcina sp. 795]AKB11801.1 hypothetical protein MSTHT_0043 [Methanosarcina thermophila TM-1]AKB15003.1 hypothetical protein MSTHC_0685 [Methanosarcina thermophila CHTI-55]NLU57524.1 hypothetical protein [Methanosarcina thermophila]SFT70494.1 hypothetical protein SAMN02910340_01902 [Methanosarcina thermophila]
MSDPNTAVRTQLARQVAHWTAAAMRLQDLDDLASPSAWNSLERYLGLSIRQHLTMVVEKLKREATFLQTSLNSASSTADILTVRRQLLTFRKRYLRVEATLDFYADAISTRTSTKMAGLLRACDTLAHRSMAQILDQLGKPTPIVLTYIDKGLGASILKAGLRLWDETSLNPVAAIKITRHNLHRPTALIHEAGHQVAHITGWSEELSAALAAGLTDAPAGVAEAWRSWASEIAADAFSFVHTGYASVASLYDVVDGGESIVFRYPPGDPHPVGYLRVLLGVEMCRQFYGAGPWDDLALAWTQQYPLQRASGGTSGQLLRESVPLLPSIVNITLRKPMRSFGGRPLVALINPERVKPETLLALEQQLGAALYTSMHWIWTEALRLLALTGLRKATSVDRTTETIKLQEQWMLRLGGALQAA